MSDISVEQIDKLSPTNPFWLMRAQAIHTHANLEQSLCMLFALVTGMPDKAAGTLFFKLNAHTRNSLLDQLFLDKYGGAHSLFWNSFLKGVREINDTRNKIIHWRTAQSIGDNDATGTPIVTLMLVQPNFWDFKTKAQPIRIEDLREFVTKCELYSSCGSQFFLGMSGVMGEAQSKTLLDKFLQPITYPLLDSHPLSQNYKAP